MTDETPASSASSSAMAQTRLLLVDDDDLFRESLGLNLQDEGFEVDDFAGGSALLSFFENGGSADAVLLDWRMPDMDGISVMRELRRRHIGLPVIFLTALSDDIYEETALDGGAVDFIDKSRRLSIVVKRIRLIVEGARAVQAEGTAAARPAVSEKGHLSLRHDTSRASWKGETAELTLTEFNIVSLLVSRSGEDVHYREIYDLVHGKDFVAGFGSEGYRANVRTFIKRIRKKFRDIDPDFDVIGNYAGFGYRWLDGDGVDARDDARGAAGDNVRGDDTD